MHVHFDILKIHIWYMNFGAVSNPPHLFNRGQGFFLHMIHYPSYEEFEIMIINLK